MEQPSSAEQREDLHAEEPPLTVAAESDPELHPGPLGAHPMLADAFSRPSRREGPQGPDPESTGEEDPGMEEPLCAERQEGTRAQEPPPAAAPEPALDRHPDPDAELTGEDEPATTPPLSAEQSEAMPAGEPPQASPAELDPASAPEPKALLAVHGLHYSRGQGDQSFRVELPALTLAASEIIALTGESGCGKSTVLELLALVARPERVGRFHITLNGDDVHDVAELWSRNAQGQLARLRARALGFVLQTGGLLPYLTVAQNIQVNRRLLGMPAADPNIEAIIQTLEIGKLLDKKPHQLSIGQQQRASIARALAHKPPLLLADEPTSALDPRLGALVMNMMLSLVRRLRISVVIATHAHEQVRQLGLREIQAEPLEGRLGSRFLEVAP